MVDYCGYIGPTPFSVIVWKRDGREMSKTVCYTKQEELEAISRFYYPGDLYSSYEKAVIHRENGHFEISSKIKEVV